MAQNRKAPSYQEYAASLLANKHFRFMNLSERGLLYTMRLECWENENLPADMNQLAKYLGVEQSEMSNAFTDNVRTFFKVEGETLNCPELDNYRQHLNEKKEKQSAGGKKGAAKTNAKFSNAGNPQGSREPLVKHSSVKQSQNQSLEGKNMQNDKHREWLSNYDQASNG